MAKKIEPKIPTPKLSRYSLDQMAAVIGSVRARLLEADPDIEQDQTLYIDCLDSESDAIAFMRALGRGCLDDLAYAEAISERIEALELRKARLERRAEAKRGALFTLMEIAQLQSLPDTDFDAGFVKGRQTVNKDIDIYVDKLPAEYVRVTTTKKVNKQRLYDDLVAGKKVEHAYLTNAEPVFQIRRK